MAIPLTKMSLGIRVSSSSISESKSSRQESVSECVADTDSSAFSAFAVLLLLSEKIRLTLAAIAFNCLPL